MHFFSSSLRFSCVALLIPALLVSAYPNSYTPRGSNEIELFKYPPSPITTIELGKEMSSDWPNVIKYKAEWVGQYKFWEPATAIKVQEEDYESLVNEAKIMGKFLASGQDKDKQLWVIIEMEEESEKETSEPEEDSPGGY